MPLVYNLTILILFSELQVFFLFFLTILTFSRNCEKKILNCETNLQVQEMKYELR